MSDESVSARAIRALVEENAPSILDVLYGSVSIRPDCWVVGELIFSRRSPDACPSCHLMLRAGDWPWCKGKPEDHLGPHYAWHFA